MSSRNRRILVVDDDQEIWRAYQVVLGPEDAGGEALRNELTQLLNADTPPEEIGSPRFDLTFAAQGQDGLALAEEALEGGSPFALAFIDMRMPPGWDGMETAARLRRLDPSVEIVIVTAYSDRSREEIVRAVGAPEKLLFLRKPFDAEELTQIALSLTEKWNLAREEAALRSSLENVLGSTPAAIFAVDAGRLVTQWNRAAEEITGYSAEQVVGKPCILAKIAVESECEECLESCSAGSGKQGHEMLIVDAEGRTRTLWKSGLVTRDERDAVSGAVESFWDITVRKETEAALQQSEARFRALVESTSDWVWEVDINSRFTYCSPLSERLYGYSPEELLGKSRCDLLQVPDNQEECRQTLRRCFEEGVGVEPLERERVRKDGSRVHVESSCVPVFGSDGRVTGLRGIDRDVTERRRGEEERLRMEERNRQTQKMEALGTLAGGIAHDLNNVLTPILGYAEMGLEEIPEADPVRHYLQVIDQCADRASGLLRQILAFSRSQVLMKKSVDLNELIRNLFKMLRRLIPENVELDLVLEPDLAAVSADPSQLEQVLVNLVVNARDAIPGNGRVEIRTHQEVIPTGTVVDVEHQPVEGRQVVVSVSDDGIGMDPATVARVFDPFFTTKEAGKGTGIGLSTAYGIVKQHQGHLALDTRLGHGATFHVYLQELDEGADVVQQPEAATVRGGVETLLLVEDNAEVRQIAAGTLRAYGYTVVEASNGTEALRTWDDSGNIDLLVTDVVMPGLSGTALAVELRGRKPSLPVLFMSGHPLDYAPPASLGGERAMFLQKPFRPRGIARKVRDLLDQRVDEPSGGVGAE